MTNKNWLAFIDPLMPARDEILVGDYGFFSEEALAVDFVSQVEERYDFKPSAALRRAFLSAAEASLNHLVCER